MIMNSIQKYEEKTGEKFQYGIDPSLSLFIPPFKDEFLLYKVGVDNGIPYIWLDQMYGSIENFIPFITMICNFIGTDKIVTATTRNPNVHIRKWKMRRLENYDYDYEGRHYHVLCGELKNIGGFKHEV